MPSTRAQVVTRRTYNRPLNAEGTKFETWEQTIGRVIAHQKWLWERAKGETRLTDEEWNEIVELQKEGAYIVGLTRDPYSKADQHVSEKEIEEALSLCDSICDNAKVGIKDSIKMVHNGLKGLPNVIPRMEK